MAALDQVCGRARQLGMACAVIHSSNHLGMLAWYVESIARAGQIGIATTISEALVHPWGGRLAMQGTNPLAIGIPATPDPLVLDMSTGLISMGKVHDYALRGRPLEPGWALDASGEPTTSADAAKAGSIRVGTPVVNTSRKAANRAVPAKSAVNSLPRRPTSCSRGRPVDAQKASLTYA